MGTDIISGLIGFALAAIFFVVLWFKKLKRPEQTQNIDIYSTVEKFRSVGELVVFKIVTKEIITASDHWFGEIGKKYFQWLASNKKMAMIFEFAIDFRYDLRRPEFKIIDTGQDSYKIVMPPCFYEAHIRDIQFYDEQRSKFLPWLLLQL